PDHRRRRHRSRPPRRRRPLADRRRAALLPRRPVVPGRRRNRAAVAGPDPARSRRAPRRRGNPNPLRGGEARDGAPGVFSPPRRWDAGAKAALPSGVPPRASRVFPPGAPNPSRPRKLGVPYDPPAPAPQPRRFLAELFADRDETTSADL